MNEKIRKKPFSLQILPNNEFINQLDKEKLRSFRTGSGFTLIAYKLNGISVLSLKKLVCTLRRRLRSADEVGWLDDDSIGVLLSGSDSIGGQAFAAYVEKTIYNHKKNGKPLHYETFIEYYSPSAAFDMHGKK